MCYNNIGVRMKLLNEFKINLDNKGLINIALTHSSYANENNCESYEKLEFLGDAVIEFIVSDYLYKNTDYSEGKMSKIRSMYVCEDALYEYSKKINLKKYIKVGHAIKEANKSIIADVFESVIAVIYLEKGINSCKIIFNKLILPYIKNKVIFSNDYKTTLQELIQTKEGVVKYSVIKESGPSHDKSFTVKVSVDGITYGIGEGKSKKEAEQNAARIALGKHV